MLCNLPYLKTYLGLAATNTAEDARLSVLLTQADSWVKEYCGQTFERQRYREYYTGRNQTFLVLRRRPVKVVHEVRLDDYGRAGQWESAFADETVLTEGADYFLDYDYSLGVDGGGAPVSWSKSGLLFRVGCAWPMFYRLASVGKLSSEMGPSVGNVYVDYSAGYDPTKADGDPEAVPPALKDAVCLLAAYRRRNAAFGMPVTREKLGRWEVETAHSRANAPIQPGVPDEVLAMLAPFRELAF